MYNTVFVLDIANRDLTCWLVFVHTFLVQPPCVSAAAPEYIAEVNAPVMLAVESATLRSLMNIPPGSSVKVLPVVPTPNSAKTRTPSGTVKVLLTAPVPGFVEAISAVGTCHWKYPPLAIKPTNRLAPSVFAEPIRRL